MRKYLLLGFIVFVSGCNDMADPLDPTSTARAGSDGDALTTESSVDAESAEHPVLQLNAYSSGYDEGSGKLLDFRVGSGLAMDPTTIEVPEGYSARLRLTLTEPVTAATTIPFYASTVRPDTSVWRVHNYDWTYHGTADHEVTPSSGFHFAANTDTATVLFKILNDSRIEPPREKVVFRAQMPEGLVSTTGNAIHFTVLEGICDRDPDVQAALYAKVKGGDAAMESDDCQDVTTENLAEITRFIFDGAAGRSFLKPSLQQGDFAGLVNLNLFAIYSMDLRDANFDKGLFADFSKVTDLLFEEVYVSRIPANTFKGVNPGIHYLEWIMNPQGDRRKRGFGGIDYRAFRGLDSLKLLYLEGFTTTSIDTRLFNQLTNLRYLEIMNFPQFNGPFEKAHFKNLTKLGQAHPHGHES